MCFKVSVWNSFNGVLQQFDSVASYSRNKLIVTVTRCGALLREFLGNDRVGRVWKTTEEVLVIYEHHNSSGNVACLISTLSPA